MADRPQHAPLIQFPIVDDELQVGGMPVSQLAEQVGQTPFYAYERESISRRVHDFRKAMPETLSLHYAMKANPMPALVAHLAGLVNGLDVASAGELEIALDSKMEPADISFAGPGKRNVELRAAVAAGITVNVESPGELERLTTTGNDLGITPNAAIRVNPDYELRSSGMKMSGGPKQFGIDAEQVPDVLRRMSELQLHFRGFHIFSGSQNLHADNLIETHDATFQLAYRLSEQAPGPVEVLNIGGGLGIPYFPGEKRLELSSISEQLAKHIESARQRLGEVEVVMELGRYLVGEAGVYVSRIIDRKISRGQVFLVVDGGLHHHLAASGNFGQIIRKNYPVVTAQHVSEGPRETVSVVGPLCTPLDLLASKMEMTEAKVGDLIAVLQSGAYGFTASPHMFLGHPKAVEVLV